MLISHNFYFFLIILSIYHTISHNSEKKVSCEIKTQNSDFFPHNSEFISCNSFFFPPLNKNGNVFPHNCDFSSQNFENCEKKVRIVRHKVAISLPFLFIGGSKLP